MSADGINSPYNACMFREQCRALQADAKRYAWLRSRDLETIKLGGVFAGKTPENLVLNGDDLDAAIDAAMADEAQRAAADIAYNEAKNSGELRRQEDARALEIQIKEGGAT